MQSQGSLDISSSSNVRKEVSNVSTQAETEREFAKLSFIDKKGSWGSLEDTPCSKNIFAKASSSSKQIKDAVSSSELIPDLSSLSSTARKFESRSLDCLGIDPASPTP